jgi:serine/threonine-protein kinase
MRMDPGKTMASQSRGPGTPERISAFARTSDDNPAVGTATVAASSSPPARSAPPQPTASRPPADGESPTDPPLGKLEDGDLLGHVVADRYRVIKKMGEGGMGVVYLAEHITIEKKIALKVLLHEYARKQDLKERFLQEARAAAKIGHENIVDITDFGDTPDGSVFFAMEFLGGVDLSHLIRKHGPMVWTRAKPILLQICRALGAAHAKGIIHRDMKPENIYLIEREGRSDFVKVLDFGIAKMNVDDRESRLTRTGMIFGTPEYMSPEQAQGNKPDHRVDIYAVGVIMYEMLTGQVPFKADTFMGILTKHIFEQPIPPSQVKPGAHIPAEVEQLVMKALAKERGERFQSMAEMAAAIAQASGRMTRPTGDVAVTPRIVTTTSTGSTAMPALDAGAPVRQVGTITDVGVGEEIYSGRRNLIIAGVVIGLLVVGGVGAFLFLRDRPDDRPAAENKPDAAVKAIVKTQPLAVDAAPRAASKHKITIVSKPAGAEIYRGDQRLGVSPEPFFLDRGSEKITLTLKLAGYKDREIEIIPDENQTSNVELEPKRAGKGKKIKPEPVAKKPEPVAKKPEPVAKKPEPVTKPEPKKPEPKKKDETSGELKNPFPTD